MKKQSLSRRNFFKQLVGQLTVAIDEVSGGDNVPLNRLQELPEDVISAIIPVFFTDETWRLNNRVVQVKEGDTQYRSVMELNDNQCMAMELFSNNLSLKAIAEKLTDEHEEAFEQVYSDTKALFFKLANNRICHPTEVYRVEDFIEKETKTSTN